MGEFDEDYFTDNSIIFTEAFGPASGVFMLSWVLSTTYLNINLLKNYFNLENNI